MDNTGTVKVEAKKSHIIATKKVHFSVISHVLVFRIFSLVSLGEIVKPEEVKTKNAFQWKVVKNLFF